MSVALSLLALYLTEVNIELTTVSVPYKVIVVPSCVNPGLQLTP